MARLTVIDFLTKWNANFADNTNGDIDEPMLREFLTDFTDSFANLDVTDLKAALASPAFTGVPTAPTPASGTNTTQLATTAFVIQEITDLIASAPGALDTLNELAAALGDDPNFATTVTNALSDKANIEWAARTGTHVVIDNNAIYGTISSPESDNISLDSSGAKIGVQGTILHQSNPAPTFPPEFKKTSGTYDTTKVNRINYRVLDTTTLTIDYTITQP